MTYQDISVPVLLLNGATEVLSAVFYSNGVATDPGVTTVGIADETGTVIVAAGTATVGDDETGRTYTVTPAALGRWTVTWTSADLGTFVQYAEVVGAHLFTIAEALNYKVNSKMGAASVETIAGARARILSDFQEITGTAFVPRWEQRTFDGSGNCRMLMPTMRVLSIVSIEERTYGTQTWTAYTSDELADVLTDDIGGIERESLGIFTCGKRNIRVTYTYGFSFPPAPIRDAALATASYDISEDRNDQRAISISTATGSTALWTPGYSGRGRAIHRLPEVDRVLRLPAYQDVAARPGFG